MFIVDFWTRSAQTLRCNSIKGSLRVALFISSLLIMPLYNDRSTMSIERPSTLAGGSIVGGFIDGMVIGLVGRISG